MRRAGVGVGAGRRYRLQLLVDSLTGYLTSLGHRVPKAAVAATSVTRHEQERIDPDREREHRSGADLALPARLVKRASQLASGGNRPSYTANTSPSRSSGSTIFRNEA